VGDHRAANMRGESWRGVQPVEVATANGDARCVISVGRTAVGGAGPSQVIALTSNGLQIIIVELPRLVLTAHVIFKKVCERCRKRASPSD